LVIVGNQKMAVFDDTQTENKLVIYPHRIEWVNRMPVARRAEGQVVPLSKTEPLRLECAHFLECVRDRRQPQTDGVNGLNVLKVLHAAGQSVRDHGQPATFHVPAAPEFFVHSSAHVDLPCEIGRGTKIWHFSHVMANCRIGANCNLGQNVNVAPNVRIGNNVKIQNNVSLYAGVELEDDVFCGPSMVFTNVINPRSHVNRKSEYKRTLVKRGASLGANSTIICGTTIGEYAFVGAGAVVTKDVPSHALVVGVPARQMGWVCECGTRLQDSESRLHCADCGKHYMSQDGGGLVLQPEGQPLEVAEMEEILSLDAAASALSESAPPVKPRTHAAYGD
jgi:UDP-2-acetamido-3-amino-2,3-dideoxy-glucuronate N-acetyltransferase